MAALLVVESAVEAFTLPEMSSRQPSRMSTIDLVRTNDALERHRPGSGTPAWSGAVRLRAAPRAERRPGRRRRPGGAPSSVGRARGRPIDRAAEGVGIPSDLPPGDGSASICNAASAPSRNASGVPTTADVGRDASDRIAVWAEVARLPERQRHVLYLRYRADLSFEEIASVMGITASAARSHATQATATLRQRLGDKSDEAGR